MNPKRALQLALAILESFKKAGQIYIDYQNVDGFTDEEYEQMLDTLTKLKRYSEEV